MAQSKYLIPYSEINRGKSNFAELAFAHILSICLRRLRPEIASAQFNLGNGIPQRESLTVQKQFFMVLSSVIPEFCVEKYPGSRVCLLSWEFIISQITGFWIFSYRKFSNDESARSVKVRIVQLVIILTLFHSTITQANPWLPEPGGWKYNLQYSKYTTPKSIKSLERDGYFTLEKVKESLYVKERSFIADIEYNIMRRQAELVNAVQNVLRELSYNARQIVIDQLFAQDSGLREYYNRIRNKKTDVINKIKQINQVQDALILSYHKWGATTDIEYGLSENISYGVGMGRDRGVEKFQTNKKTDRFSIFFKTRLYENKKYIFTLQPKFLTLGPLQGADLSIILGKSHRIKRKIFGKKVETFFYSSLGATRFLNSNIMRNQLHTEVTSGIKWNDSTILMNQESEDYNPEMGKNYRNILRSQFTIAQDLNFASIEPRNKVYLALSYFMIDSLKGRRRLSSGYSVGLWLEF